MKLRNMASVYITHGDEILLLYRRGSRVANNSYVASAGGHFEEGELNSPRACVEREMYEELGLRPDEVVTALDAISAPVSLFDPVYTDAGESMRVMDQVGDTKNTDAAWLEHIALSEAVQRLQERERRILALRFFDGKTQMEVAAEIGISQAQVSRLEKNAVGQIKKALFPA